NQQQCQADKNMANGLLLGADLANNPEQHADSQRKQGLLGGIRYRQPQHLQQGVTLRPAETAAAPAESKPAVQSGAKEQRNAGTHAGTHGTITLPAADAKNKYIADHHIDEVHQQQGMQINARLTNAAPVPPEHKVHGYRNGSCCAPFEIRYCNIKNLRIRIE